MNFSYLMRLFCLSFASFFVWNAVLTLLMRAASPGILAFSETRPPRAGARSLLALRLLPFAVATLFVIVLCVPSYLWLEPASSSERLGPLCLALGGLALLASALSTLRSVVVLLTSWRFHRRCAEQATEVPIPGEPRPLLVLEGQAPVLAISGLLRPRVLISRSVLQTLSPEELGAALRHEHAHRASFDNFKRFLLLLAPDALPFARAHRPLEQRWLKLAEWAADDYSAAGDTRLAVSLASALLRVARLGAPRPLPLLSTSLLSCGHDLSARVDRLLHCAPRHESRPASRAWFFGGYALFAAACFSAVLLAPLLLSSVHNLLERFLH